MLSVHRWTTTAASALMLACGNASPSEEPASGEAVAYKLVSAPSAPMLGLALATSGAAAPTAGTTAPAAGAAADASPGLHVQFCHAGACKVTLAPQFDLDFQVDWSECSGSAEQSPFAAGTTGVMSWPTTLVDLAIPLADSGWLCKLPPSNTKSECIVSASQSARELYIWGPVETACSFFWGRTPEGIDAALGAGCGMCKVEQVPGQAATSFAFNMGFDTSCRCPKARFSAMPAKL